jgi:DNA-binding MarR family transcriptional regulator
MKLTMSKKTAPLAVDEAWRQTHLGRLLGHAMRKFDARVRSLMAQDDETPLALSNLAARDKVGAAHIHITRHLSLLGDRITGLAERAGISKQAMLDLVDQCEAWGLVVRVPDPHDRRAKIVCYTEAGREWHWAFHRAVQQAELEFIEAVGEDVATVVRLGLEAYGSDYGDQA